MKPGLLLLSVLFFCRGTAVAGEIQVAVASNFSAPIQAVARQFEQQTGHHVIPVTGSTGKHYAQIRNGAPFAAFFAADTRRPALLEAEGLAIQGSRFTYAVGRLVLWSPDPGMMDGDGDILRSKKFRFLAIANPKLAPYGKAAEQVMRKLGVWEKLQQRMVRGENIGQAFQFVRSANAQLGFVAYSQIRQPGLVDEGAFWVPPQSLYAPIEQQAVLLRDDKIARDFLEFVKSKPAQVLIREFGYGVP